MSRKDSININLSNQSESIREDFEPNQAIVEQVVRHNQKIETKQETIKHLIAIMIIVPYICLLLFNSFFEINIPQAYETISLIIIGYYFAKHIL